MTSASAHFMQKFFATSSSLEPIEETVGPSIERAEAAEDQGYPIITGYDSDIPEDADVEDLMDEEENFEIDTERASQLTPVVNEGSQPPRKRVRRELDMPVLVARRLVVKAQREKLE